MKNYWPKNTGMHPFIAENWKVNSDSTPRMLLLDSSHEDKKYYASVYSDGQILFNSFHKLNPEFLSGLVQTLTAIAEEWVSQNEFN